MTHGGVVLNRGIRPSRQAIPAMPDVLAKMLTDLPPPKSQLGIRSRAKLLLGFGASLHHSELVGLGISDVARVVGRGLTVLVQRSKTDKHGRGTSSRSVSTWQPAHSQAPGSIREVFRPFAARPARDRDWGSKRRLGRSDAADTT